jgi:glycerophosphoryl diester phosphodiesterase
LYVLIVRNFKITKNSLHTFFVQYLQKAIDIGCDAIEFDVHLSLDGEIVVMHDEKIDRTTNGTGFINQLSSKELSTFLIDDEHTIPTLREVIDLVDRKCIVNIELKTFETVEKVIALIEYYIENKNWQYVDFLVSSFDWNALQNLRFLNEQIPIGVLTETNIDLAFAFAKSITAEVLLPYFHLLNRENVIKMQENGIKVIAWTVNESEDIEKIKKLNIEGIISDFPDRI